MSIGPWLCSPWTDGFVVARAFSIDWRLWELWIGLVPDQHDRGRKFIVVVLRGIVFMAIVVYPESARVASFKMRWCCSLVCVVFRCRFGEVRLLSRFCFWNSFSLFQMLIMIYWSRFPPTHFASLLSNPGSRVACDEVS